MLVISVALR